MNHNQEVITIHKAELGHASGIAELAQQLAAHEGEETLCNEKRVAALMTSNEAPQCHLLVALREGEVIGFVAFYAGYDLSSDSYGFHLADICVQQTLRCHGVGRKLLQVVAQQSQEQGREWVSLTALPSNEEAQGFYQSLGFQNVGVDFLAIGQQGLINI